MTQDLQRVGQFVDALVRRERWLLGLSSALRVGVVAMVVVAGVLLAPLSGGARHEVAAVLIVLAGLGLFGAAAVPFVRRWRPASDRLRQARLVESLQPGLRGRLITVVDRLSGPRDAESPAILGLTARRAWAGVAEVPPSTVHPAGAIVWLAALGALCAMATSSLFLVVPGGPQGVAAWWAGGEGSTEQLVQADVQGSEAPARVGDVVLRYVYPSYTGLDPYEVANSTGEALGPPGTTVQVVARSAQVVEAAALVAYSDQALDASVIDGRQVSASFTIQTEPGTYKLVLYSDGEATDSREFPITPELDLPPEVMIDASSDVIEVAVDESFPFMWTARDDYGVQRVVLEVDGVERQPDLSRARERRVEVSDVMGLRPSDIGLTPGKQAELVIAAWDNDTWSGSKVGRSRALRVIVLGRQGTNRLDDTDRERLLGLIIDILADHLEEPFPPGATAGSLSRWGEGLSARYQTLRDFVEENWRGFASVSPEARLVGRIMDDATELIRFTQVSFLPGSAEPVGTAALETLAELQDDTIVALEDGALILDRTLQASAYRALAEEADSLVFEADRLQAALQREDVDPLELVVQLDALVDQLQRVSEAAAALRTGGLRDYAESRVSELSMLIEEIREALASGDTERAEQLMERLAEQIGEMSEGIQENLQSMIEQGNQQQSEAASLKETLEEIAAEQQSLRDQVEEIRRENGEQLSQQMSEIWTQVEEELAEVASGCEGYASGLRANERHFNEQQRAEWALSSVEGLARAVGARDLYGARASTDALSESWRSVHRGYLSLFWDDKNPPDGPGLPEINGVNQGIDRLYQLLDQLERTDSSIDPDLREKVREHLTSQQRLSQRLQSAQEQAQQVVQEMTVTPHDLKESLESASSRMEQAEGHLRQGEPMQSEGSQGAATEHVRDAIRSLQDAMQQQQQQQQQMSGDKPEEGEEKSGDQKPRQIDALDIPEPEEFRTPEEYRRALLEGMEGGVPEEFRALKKRYYEELVHQ